MKKILNLTLVLIIIFTLGGCGDTSDKDYVEYEVYTKEYIDDKFVSREVYDEAINEFTTTLTELNARIQELELQLEELE